MLKIYNSLTNKKEFFEPKKQGKVNMYVCGPTVYDDIHLGNGRPVVFFDVVKRYLTFIGYDVFYASNITDVDDRIIAKAASLKVSEDAVAKKYADAFFEVVQSIGSQQFDLTPHATNYIEQMIKFIKKLIDDGFAYIVKSGIYFNVAKVDDYGILSNQKIEELKKGVRIDLEVDKRDDVDFALWKFTEQGVKYDSPWGKGRPGWHTECVVMNYEIFDEEADIHGGGFDLKFPHHENEIAQSVAHSHHHLAKYWMHVGRLDMGKEKMSKSLGNDIKIKTLLKKFNGNAYRFMLLAHHYRRPFQFTDDLIEQYQNSYDKISYTLNKWNFNFKLKETKPVSPRNADIEAFKKLMDDDFNTGLVVTLLDQLIKELNKLESIEVFESIKTILNVLGIVPKINEPESADLEKYNLWQQARSNKDYQQADVLRDYLSNKGWI